MFNFNSFAKIGFLAILLTFSIIFSIGVKAKSVAENFSLWGMGKMGEDGAWVGGQNYLPSLENINAPLVKTIHTKIVLPRDNPALATIRALLFTTPNIVSPPSYSAKAFKCIASYT